MDLQFDGDGDVAHGETFDTSIVVSLGTDARATAAQMPIPERRRGWIGNDRTPGQEMGGLLWLFEQARLNGATALGIEDIASNALSWFVDEAFATSVVPTAVLQKNANLLLLGIQITHTNGDVEDRYFELWANTGRTFLVPVVPD